MKSKPRKKYFTVRKYRVPKFKKKSNFRRTNLISLSENVKEANAVIDLLNPCICESQQYFKDGADQWKVECFHASSLDLETKNWAFELCKQNVKHMYETVGGWNEDEKVKELTEEAARFLLVRNTTTNELVAFSHFRFDMDYGEEVLYCYELHVIPEAQRKGLGKALLDLLELLSFTYKMSKVVLTVFKVNEHAIRFYRKCGYEEDCTSPVDHPYLILSKYVNT